MTRTARTSSCGTGCACTGGDKKETLCSDGVDNDGDGQKDCEDPDCAASAAEVCGDGMDNDCNRAFDCADSACGGTACTQLTDGAPCTSDGQCKGGKCRTEATTGAPNGYCSNATCLHA